MMFYLTVMDRLVGKSKCVMCATMCVHLINANCLNNIAVFGFGIDLNSWLIACYSTHFDKQITIIIAISQSFCPKKLCFSMLFCNLFIFKTLLFKLI